MWKRFAGFVVCPVCGGPLELLIVDQTDEDIAAEHVRAARDKGIAEKELCTRVETGLFLCSGCRTKFPILNGLPILLTYQTGAHALFARQHDQRLGSLQKGFTFPNKAPATGEEAVRESFSEEWQAYDYDGVIWELSYEDHESRLVSEIGPLAARQRRTFLEVGCGVGLTTMHAQRNFGVDAVGMDLSTAPAKAASKFQKNPFLHYVQASVFALPFPRQSFDLVYSRGVLHHTFSTEKAFQRVAPLCRAGGTLYLWVYGPGSISRSPLRIVLYAGERMLRPVLSRDASSPFARMVLATLAFPYWLYNSMRRVTNPAIQKLNFKRAVHAARDRFTPKFAHRHSADEVSSWFREAGFRNIEIVDWRAVPKADHADFGRNTAVRGVAGPA